MLRPDSQGCHIRLPLGPARPPASSLKGWAQSLCPDSRASDSGWFALAHSCVVTGMTRFCSSVTLLRFDGNSRLLLHWPQVLAERPFSLHASDVLVSEGGCHRPSLHNVEWPTLGQHWVSQGCTYHSSHGGKGPAVWLSKNRVWFVPVTLSAERGS